MTLTKGEPAPFEGDLFPVVDSIRMGLAVESCDERASIEIHHAKRLFDIELATEKALAASIAQSNGDRIYLLESRLEYAAAWYRSPPFIAAVATVVTVSAMLAATVLIRSAAEVPL